MPSRHRGSVALFYRDFPNFTVEAIRQFGANVIPCQLATGERQLYIVVCYLAPGDRAKIQDVKAKMSERLWGVELIAAGDLNIDLERTGGWGRDKEIATVVATAGLEDPFDHLFTRQRPWCRDRRTWVMVRQGR